MSSNQNLRTLLSTLNQGPIFKKKKKLNKERVRWPNELKKGQIYIHTHNASNLRDDYQPIGIVKYKSNTTK